MPSSLTKEPKEDRVREKKEDDDDDDGGYFTEIQMESLYAFSGLLTSVH